MDVANGRVLLIWSCIMYKVCYFSPFEYALHVSLGMSEGIYFLIFKTFLIFLFIIIL